MYQYSCNTNACYFTITFLSRSFSSDISEVLESFDQTDIAVKITDFSLYISQHSSSSFLNTLLLNREREREGGREGGWEGGRGRKGEREREALDAMYHTYHHPNYAWG
jgi:hypothetical protein